MNSVFLNFSRHRKALRPKFPVNFSPAEVRPNLYGVD